MEPTFLTIDEIVAIHRDQIARYGGSEGVRDWGLLQSAIAMPAATFGGQFLHGDLCEMAAAYLFHIVQNHPFIDGNKRVGAAAAYVFLALNDLRLTADNDAYSDLVLSVARGETPKSRVADFFRAARPRLDGARGPNYRVAGLSRRPRLSSAVRRVDASPPGTAKWPSPKSGEGRRLKAAQQFVAGGLRGVRFRPPWKPRHGEALS